ncbi:MAG: dihydropteroate synthase [Planctomycetota bacterium]
MTLWKTSRRTLACGTLPDGGRPLIMGILNVTPDSFSDGGRHFSVDKAIQAACEMAAGGASIIDIGGESTRPYSEPVDAATEMDRVVPVIKALAGRLDVPISIDTSKAAVAKAAVEAGAEIINDVTGLEGDAAMIDVVVGSGAGVCVMHMQGTPQTMQDDPTYEDVVGQIEQYLIARDRFCQTAGIDGNAICLDPGIGFGKTHDHNLTLMRAISRFAALGRPLLIGHSRKGFIRKTLQRAGCVRQTDEADFDPTAGTLGASMAAALGGAHVLRVHDVPQTIQALELFAACAPATGSTTGR